MTGFNEEAKWYREDARERGFPPFVAGSSKQNLWASLIRGKAYEIHKEAIRPLIEKHTGCHYWIDNRTILLHGSTNGTVAELVNQDGG